MLINCHVSLFSFHSNFFFVYFSPFFYFFCLFFFFPLHFVHYSSLMTPIIHYWYRDQILAKWFTNNHCKPSMKNCKLPNDGTRQVFDEMPKLGLVDVGEQVTLQIKVGKWMGVGCAEMVRNGHMSTCPWLEGWGSVHPTTNLCASWAEEEDPPRR